MTKPLQCSGWDEGIKNVSKEGGLKYIGKTPTDKGDQFEDSSNVVMSPTKRRKPGKVCTGG